MNKSSLDELKAILDGAAPHLRPYVEAAVKNRTEIDRLKALIGYPPVGPQGPDSEAEWLPRAETWHAERLNWISENERLRAHCQRLEEVMLGRFNAETMQREKPAKRDCPDCPIMIDAGDVTVSPLEPFACENCGEDPVTHEVILDLRHMGETTSLFQGCSECCGDYAERLRKGLLAGSET